MEHRQKLLNLYDNGNYDDLISFAFEIRKNASKVAFFGLRKNYFNVIYVDDYQEEAKSFFEKLNYHVIICNKIVEFKENVKDGKIKIEDAIKNIVIITNKWTMCDALAVLNFPHIGFIFSCKVDYDTWESYFLIRNIETKEIFKFINIDSIITGIIREEKINSILED